MKKKNRAINKFFFAMKIQTKTNAMEFVYFNEMMKTFRTVIEIQLSIQLWNYVE